MAKTKHGIFQAINELNMSDPAVVLKQQHGQPRQQKHTAEPLAKKAM